MSFDFQIPTPDGQVDVSISPGSSAIFVGANGGGKTRLAAHIEDVLGLNAHRISAHRALNLNPAVPKIAEQTALLGLRTGHAHESASIGNRIGSRWGSKAAVSLLNDFDFLLQALFAEQANKSLETHKRVRAGGAEAAEATKFERLVEIWEQLLPNRTLSISGDDIEVSVPGIEEPYKASELSDGERAIFYLIGQALMAAEDSLLIIDEPELHVHRSIMSKLWDDLEAARPDCGIVFITHDLEFAASRPAKKFVIREYHPAPNWTMDAVPEESGFDEETATLILGSRKPILFVEGDQSSLDQSIYRSCYPDWTVIPRGSCEEVIHSVVTMRNNEDLTRVTCSGIVDADDYQPDDIAYLGNLGVAALNVSEIENLILLPAVSRVIAEHEGYEAAELNDRLNNLKVAIFATLDAEQAIERVVVRYCRRRIDRLLKKIDLSDAGSTEEIVQSYTQKTDDLDIQEIAQAARDRIQTAIDNNDLELLLANYDNKVLLALAATHLKQTGKAPFEAWIARALRNNLVPGLIDVARANLPDVDPV